MDLAATISSGLSLLLSAFCLIRTRAWRRQSVLGGPPAASDVEAVLRELHARSKHRHGALHLHDVEEVLRRTFG